MVNSGCGKGGIIKNQLKPSTWEAEDGTPKFKVNLIYTVTLKKKKKDKGFYFKTFRCNIGKICNEKLLENLKKVHNLTVILSLHPTSL